MPSTLRIYARFQLLKFRVVYPSYYGLDEVGTKQCWGGTGVTLRTGDIVRLASCQ